jgi:E3 ubiquitin-protein ligase SHPRH
VQVPEFHDLEEDIREAEGKIMDLEVKLTRAIVQSRYLQYLESRENGEEEMRDDCIICMGSSEDVQGLILGCGHFFCRVSRQQISSGPLDADASVLFQGVPSKLPQRPG